MAVLEKQKRYNEKNIKRIPLDIQKSYYETVLKPAAESAGLAINTYIKNAIAEKIERESK